MLGLGFQVVVCDPREEYYDTWDVQGAILTKNMPDDVVLEMKPNARTAIVALTHDPKLDDMALLEALNTNAFYVAALARNCCLSLCSKDQCASNKADRVGNHGARCRSWYCNDHIF